MVGATATGKTALAEALAEPLGAAIVCADSRQVFRELEIGTGKPSPRRARRAPSPSVRRAGARGARQRRMVRAHGERRAPRSLAPDDSRCWWAARVSTCARPSTGWRASRRTTPSGRARLGAELAAVGPEALHARLSALDPETAARVAPRDRQRITRALEVAEASGRLRSWWRRRHRPDPSTARWLYLEIVVTPGTLRERIARRTRWMFDHGLVEETRALLDTPQGEALRSLKAVGYDEAIALIEGRVDRATAEARTTLRTAQLAKRQRTWFRHQVEAVRLDGDALDPAELVERALAACRTRPESAVRRHRAPPRR